MSRGHQQKLPPASPARRGVLGAWARGLAVGAWLALLYPLWRFLRFAVPKKPRRVTVAALNPAGFHIDEEFILFADDKDAWAVSRRCTHLGCPVSYNQSQDALICPCHHSRFSRRGQRLAGPARRNLATYKVERTKQGGYVVVI